MLIERWCKVIDAAAARSTAGSLIRNPRKVSG
jgi:hypothetical protein